MPRGDTDAVFEGAAGQTRTEATHWSCPCGQVVSVKVVRAVHAARDPVLAEQARADSLHRVTCPACTAVSAVELVYVYHDAAARRMILVLPSTLRHRELDERAAFMAELARDRAHRVPAYARDFVVAFGADGLRAELARPPAATAPAPAPPIEASALARRVAELDAREAQLARRAAALEAREAQLHAATGPHARLDDLHHDETHEAHEHDEGSGAHLMPTAPAAPAAPRATTANATPAPMPGRGSTSAPPPGASAVVTARPATPGAGPAASVVRKTPPSGSRDLAVERWIASREPARALTEHGHVRLLATAPSARLEDLVHGQLVPRLQLFRTPSYPLIVLSVRLHASLPDADAPVTLLLDLQRVDDRSLLGALALGFRLELELHDAQHQPVVHRTVGAPLEDNVRAVIAAAEEHLASLPAGQRSFEAAGATWRSTGFDRHGRRAHSLEEDSFSHLPSAAATQVALTVVGFWSESDHQDYLVLERAFPLPWWRRIRSRVVKRAVDLGLVLPASLIGVAVGEGLARSRKDLAGKLARAFAETCARGSDLDAGQTQDNWRAIVGECEALGVALEGSAADLAAQAVGVAPHPPPPTRKELAADAKAREVAVARRAMSSPVVVGETGGPTPAKLDLGRSSQKDLVGLLDDKDARKDAALELCKRAEPAGVGPVFGAIRRMTRGEAVRVLPHVVGFGERAVPHLLDGLRSRKGFLRHGCALALGVIKSGEGIEALCDLLLSEPTEIWREVARAVGELGAGAVMSLAARLRDAAPERRDRIAWALAHVVARGGRGPVETLAGGRDTVAAGAAQRALELGDQARSNDAEVRGLAPARDQTVNRAFSRRFFEAMAQNGAPVGGGFADVELSADDAVILEEAIDDDEELLDEEDLIPG